MSDKQRELFQQILNLTGYTSRGATYAISRLAAQGLEASQPPAVKGAEEQFTEIDKARFWTKVQPTDYCWLWTANKNGDGYGMFKHHGYDEHASRVAYKISNGGIPDELHVCHKCDNPACVNPDHLFTGTHQDNMNDRMRKGRGKVLGRASRYHGVAFRKDSNNWRAQAFDGKKHLALGSYPTEIEAARARDKAVIERGLDLPLNFPESIRDESGTLESPTAAGELPADVIDKILKARDALVERNVDEAYHQLYAIASPYFDKLEPWKDFEEKRATAAGDGEAREMIENILYATGKFFEEQCTELAEIILKELKAAGDGKEDAVAFGDWIGEQNYKSFRTTKHSPVEWFKGGRSDRKAGTTAQLYDLYLTDKNK